MINILDTIIAHKQKEVAERKAERPIAELEKETFFHSSCLSLKASLLDKNKTGIIAEFKRRSPSKGIINDQAAIEQVTKAYADQGASALSVLTDLSFFGGALEDLHAAKKNGIPVLRKEFIIDEYQLIEAKANGADAVLLIAACLSPLEVKNLARQARLLGMEVLLELHDEKEADCLCGDVDMAGVNNRDLRTFEVDLEHSVRMAEKIGDEMVKVAESGMQDVKDIRYLKKFGFHGFLIGEHFMKQRDPGKAFQTFVSALKGDGTL
jgi:indole-3-glycerol phosphate synthase